MSRRFRGCWNSSSRPHRVPQDGSQEFKRCRPSQWYQDSRDSQDVCRKRFVETSLSLNASSFSDSSRLCFVRFLQTSPPSSTISTLNSSPPSTASSPRSKVKPLPFLRGSMLSSRPPLLEAEREGREEEETRWTNSSLESISTSSSEPPTSSTTRRAMLGRRGRKLSRRCRRSLLPTRG